MACAKKVDLDNPSKFISILKDFPILLEKSCVPSIRDKRNKAIEDIQTRIEREMGVSLDSTKILKKFNNLKTRVKSTSDINKTGNKKVILKPWEEDLLKFIVGDTDNAAVVRLKGAVTAVINDSIHNDSDINSDSVSYSSDLQTMSEKSTVKEVRKKKINTADQHTDAEISHQPKKKTKFSESDETKDLSLSELQRLVLLKQLEYFKKAEELVDIKLKREKAKTNQEPQLTLPLQLQDPNLTFPMIFVENENHSLTEL